LYFIEHQANKEIDMLTQTIVNDMKQAMKSRNKVALNAIRMLRAAIKDYEIQERKEADDQAVIQLVTKLAKKHKEAIQQFSDAGRDELAEKERQELKTLEVYLPQQLAIEEVQQLIETAITESDAKGIRDMGKVMQQLRAKVAGKTDMSALSAMVKKALQA